MKGEFRGCSVIDVEGYTISCRLIGSSSPITVLMLCLFFGRSICVWTSFLIYSYMQHIDIDVKYVVLFIACKMFCVLVYFVKIVDWFGN